MSKNVKPFVVKTDANISFIEPSNVTGSCSHRYPLTGTDESMLHVYTDIGYVLDSRINRERFFDALVNTLKNYPLFFSDLEFNDGWSFVLNVGYSKNQKYRCVEFQYQEIDLEKNLLDPASLYLENILDFYPKPGKDKNPLLKIRLTNFENSSVIGTILCHALSDGIGLYRFFFRSFQ
uniref:Condensation domain-containing protein n=1 Tax=Candidatus Kentrum sp. LPFa TaxID=2126335 RepID=A0A450W628_9GAMM|nr:MAG: hypothetical protein BECKLPF1236A_GA0070988_100729 [Candidatus Kentron sp. LPFa]VFK28730.1 MAG: hypothetical protein BECKLPF1236C_GA0070990_100738 [Candidatus Kentron sp. LPFa]